MIKINVKTSSHKYFRQLLELLGSFDPFSSMRSREKDVFAILLRSNWLLKSKSKAYRDEYLLSREHRVYMATELKISDINLNMIISSLRKRGVIVDNSIDAKYEFKPIKELTFNFEEERK
jgi:hypothetical protein